MKAMPIEKAGWAGHSGDKHFSHKISLCKFKIKLILWNQMSASFFFTVVRVKHDDVYTDLEA